MAHSGKTTRLKRKPERLDYRRLAGLLDLEDQEEKIVTKKDRSNKSSTWDILLDDSVCAVCKSAVAHVGLEPAVLERLEWCITGRLAHAAVCKSCKKEVDHMVVNITSWSRQSANKVDRRNCQKNFTTKDNFCLMCGVRISKDLENKIYITDVDKTSLEHRLTDVVALILEEGWSEDDYSRVVCQSCYRELDTIDWLHRHHLSNLQQMRNKFINFHEKKDKSFICGSVHDMADLRHVYLHVASVHIPSEENRALLHLENLVGQSLDHSNCHVIDRLKNVNLHIAKEIIGSLDIFESQDGKYLINFKQMLMFKPRFSINEVGEVVLLIADENENGESKSFICQSCNVNFDYLYIMFHHLERHLEGRDKARMCGTLPKLFTCQFCLEEFDRKSEFKSHTFVCRRDSLLVPVHKCSYCNIFQKDKDALEAHIAKEHKGTKAPWKCTECDKRFTRKASYHEHVARHKGIKDRYCDKCDKHFYETAYWRHVACLHPTEDKRQYVCPHCNRMFPIYGKFRQHIATHMPDSEKRVECNECGKMYANNEKLRLHQRNVHRENDGKSYACFECGVNYSNYSSMCSHIKRCHELNKPRPLPCPHCPQMFPTSASRSKHVTICHPDHRKYICGFSGCDNGFSDLQDLQNHQVIHHPGNTELDQSSHPDNRIIFMGEIGDQSDDSPDVQNIANKILDTTQEGNILLEDTLLLSTEDEQTNQQMNPTVSNVKSLDTIPLSQGTVLGMQPSLSISLDIETDDNYLSAGLDIPTAVDEHLLGYNVEPEAESPSESLDLCAPRMQACPSQESEEWVSLGTVRPAKSPVEPVEPPQAVDGSHKPFSCSVCNKRFTTKKNLNRHFRVHTGEKPFECEYCLRKFAAHSNLSEHRTIHTGRKPYCCKKCGDSFRLWSAFNKHSGKCVKINKTSFDLIKFDEQSPFSS